MLTAMDPTKSKQARDEAGEVLAEQLHAFATEHRTTYQQARQEAISWFQCDQLNRGDLPQETPT